MSINSYTLIIRAIRATTKKAFSGLRIEAWDKDKSVDDFIGEGITGSDGRVKIAFTQARFRDYFPEKNPDVYFNVYRGETLLMTTDVIVDLKQTEAELLIIVDEKKATGQAVNAKTAIAIGTVLLNAGTPAVNVLVRAFQQELTGELLLGESKTDADGVYSVTYTVPLKGTRLFVRVYANDQATEPLVESPVLYKPGDKATINLRLPAGKNAGRSLYETIEHALDDKTENIPVDQLTDRQLGVLADSTGMPLKALSDYRIAKQKHEQHHSLPGTFFFAMARNRKLRKDEQWLRTNLSTVSHILQEAQQKALIPVLTDKQLQLQLRSYQLLRTRYHIDAPLLSGKGTLNGLLKFSSVSEAGKEAVAAAYADYASDATVFWSMLEKESSVASHVVALKKLFSLHKLTIGNLPLVEKLKNNKAVSSLESLARWNEVTWQSALNDAAVRAAIPESITGKTEGERVTAYATYLQRLSSFLHPTPAMAAAVNDYKEIPSGERKDLQTFFTTNTGFHIESHSVAEYLSTHPDALKNVGDKTQLVRNLEDMSRRFALAPVTNKAEGGHVLFKLGISSATGVTSMGWPSFNANYTLNGGTVSDATWVFNTALTINAQLQLLGLNYVQDRLSMPYVIPDTLHQDPVWLALFGSEDMCNCSDCRSVYSPAAYLADLLHFIEQFKQIDPQTGEEVPYAYNALIARRPDIQRILLNCPNAFEPLPYIDLVNEVLENAVALQPDFSWQTTHTAEELRVLPEHINQQAYQVLASAKYPSALPFDLFTETGRQFLAQLGAPQEKFMALLLPSAGAKLADARLGILPEEHTMLTATEGTYAENDWWGLPDSWSATGAGLHVSQLLLYSGLSFAQLQELLLTRFVNAGDIHIDYATDCSLDGAVFEKLDRKARLHLFQFVRLQRKSGLSARDLDHFLTAIRATAIDSQTIIRLSIHQEIRERYSLSADEVSSWWGVLPTAHPADAEGTQMLYESLFLHRSMEPTGAVSAFTLNETRTALLHPADAAQPVVFNYLLGALQADAATLTFAIGQVGSWKLELEHLSLLYAMFSMAKAMRVTIEELFQLKAISSVDPFLPENTIRFADSVALLAKNGYEIAEVNYLLRHSDAATYAWTEAQLSAALEEIHNAVSGEDTQEARAEKLHSKIASLFDTNAALAAQLLNYLHEPAGLRTLGEVFATADVGGNNLSVQRDGLVLLQKTTSVLSKLQLASGNAAKLLSETGRTRFFNFDLLPVQPVSGGVHAHFLALEGVWRIRSYQTQTTDTAFSVWDAIGRNQLPELFETDHAEQQVLDQLLATQGSTVPVEQIGLLWELAKLKSRLGLRLSDWMHNNKLVLCESRYTAEVARQIVALARSRYNSADWQKEGGAVRDRLRMLQRDALVQYLLGVNRANGIVIEDLYAHFLVDVEMSACMMTSRIRLALSSVQLFVQRCLLNLEPAVDFSALTTEQLKPWNEWSWRKNYRLWEANRKIFLYPENWLEPEWRDDKTAFFRELEEEIQQKQLTNEAAENAYLNYLEKLRQVSNPQVMAICKGEAAGTFYIFARSSGDPRDLYFVRYDQSNDKFSSWEKTDVGVEGDHLIPVMMWNRLFLFWPVFKEKRRKKEQETDLTQDAGQQEKDLYWEIHMKWAEYHNGAWTERKVSEEFIETFTATGAFSDEPRQGNVLQYSNVLPYQGEKTDYYFTADTPAGSSVIMINVYVQDHNDDNTFVSHGEFPEFNTYTDPDQSKFSDSAPRPSLPVNSDFYIDEDSLDDLADKLPAHIGFFRFEYPAMRSQPMQAPDVLQQQLKLADYVKKPEEIYGQQWIVNGALFLGDAWLLQADTSGPYAASFETTGLLRTPAFSIGNNSPLVIRHKKQSYLVCKPDNKFLFLPLYHPFIAEFRLKILTEGFSGFFSPEGSVQEYEADAFSNLKPNPNLVRAQEKPLEKVTFERKDLYAAYNWELFFHIPALIAVRMSQGGMHEEAMTWFHYIFNPMQMKPGENSVNCWVPEVFQTNTDSRSIRDLLNSEDQTPQAYADFESRVKDWQQNPFNPHAVALTRTIAYMKWVVMKYIDNLLEWADQLFRQDTMESTNEATQLYILAWNMLGRKPEELPGTASDDKSYADIRDNLDKFSNAWVLALEERVATAYTNASESRERRSFRESMSLPSHPFSTELQLPSQPAGHTWNLKPQLPELFASHMLYFCIPANEKFLAYWTQLGDRFYKLRNCLNIEGIYRQLPLYDPPIDPALLAAARVAGLSIDQVMHGDATYTRIYRFQFLLQRAYEYAAEVRNLGAALLGAIEKQDGEQVAQLRSLHEVTLLNAMLQVKTNQLKEAEEVLETLDYSLSMANKRKEYYSTKEFMNGGEKTQMLLMAVVNRMQLISQASHQLASSASTTPQITMGTVAPVGAVTAVTSGGEQAASAATSNADSFSALASILNISASEIGQMASYQRRYEDWMHQSDLATDEVAQAEKNILAARIRIAIAHRELDNHELQTEQTKAERDLLQTKFSNRDLYYWMTGQLKTLYYQSYQMALAMAHRAEAALKFELPALSTTVFVKDGYWNASREGLLSGEKLHQDLRRMEMMYIDKNVRLHEISKTVSLAMLDAEQLVVLKTLGTCTFSVSKELFDLDFPQHAERKRHIKAVSLTIPNVSGPYTGVNCILSLTENGVPVASIATSSGVNDSGLFQFSFNDERYLPFERADVTSQWSLSMNSGARAFDFNTISDVLLHIHYTVDPPFANAPLNLDVSRDLQLTRYISVRNEFPDEWFAFRNAASDSCTVVLTPSFFPYRYKNKWSAMKFEAKGWTYSEGNFSELGNLAVSTEKEIILSQGSAADDVILVVTYHI